MLQLLNGEQMSAADDAAVDADATGIALMSQCWGWTVGREAVPSTAGDEDKLAGGA
jgi:hypothetical protein